MITEIRRDVRLKKNEMVNLPKKKIQNIFSNIIDDFREMTLYKQLMTCYILMLIVFLSVILVAKYIQIQSILNAQVDQNYYSNIITQLIDKQREEKIELDKINNNEYVSTYYSQVLYYRIYTQELTLHKLSIRSSTGYVNPYVAESVTASSGIYAFLGENYILASNLTQLIGDAGKTNENQIDTSLYLPVIYSFIPLFYQNMKYTGIELTNFYFMGYSVRFENCSKTKTYFKYPLEKPEVNIGISPLTNIQMYDTVLDPMGMCFQDQETPKSIRVNWYSNYEKAFLNSTRQSEARFLALLKLGLNYQKFEYITNYISYKIQSAGAASKETFVLTFAQSIDRAASQKPYIMVQNNTISMDHFSMLNYPERLKNVDIKLEDEIYFYDYNIDDNMTLVEHIPGYINNLYKYTMLPKAGVESSKININSLMLTYGEMSRIQESYQINYYFREDSNLFELITFLNNYFLFLKAEREYQENENVTTHMDGTADFHRCYITNLTDYYQHIKINYDCMRDYCFYNPCSSASTFYKPPEEIQFLPNCYCIPLFCNDEFTTDYPKEIKSQLDSVNNSDSHFFNKDPIENPPYSSPSKGEFTCRTKFFNKNFTTRPSNYYSKIYLQDMKFKFNTTMFMMFLLKDDEIQDKILTSLNDYIKQIVWIFVVLYLSLLAIVIVILFKCMSKKLKITTRRMEDVKSIIKIIIKISENSENEGYDSEITDKDNDIDENENEKIDNEKGNDLQLKIKKKSLDKRPDLRPKSSISSQRENSSNNNEEEGEANTENPPKAPKFYGLNTNELAIFGFEKKGDNGEFTVSKFSDELQEFISMIADNIQDFKIEFNVNENMYENRKSVNRHFQEISNMKFFMNRLFPRRMKIRNNVIPPIFNENDIISHSKRCETSRSESGTSSHREDTIKSSRGMNNEESLHTEESHEDFSDNLSLAIIYELMSTEEMVDFSQLKSNFYFREPNETPKLDFYNAIKLTLKDDETNNGNEMTDSVKLMNAVKYYMNEIHLKWKEEYDQKRRKEEI